MGRRLPPHWALIPLFLDGFEQTFPLEQKRVALKVNVARAQFERFGGDELPYPDSTSRRRAGGNY